MDTSFLHQVPVFFVDSMLSVFISRCQKTITSSSSLHHIAIKGDAADLGETKAQFNVA